MARPIPFPRKTARPHPESNAIDSRSHRNGQAELRSELTRQRALLLTSSSLSLTAEEETETCSDLADQASTDFEQDLAMQVKSRTFDKLRRIEQALQLMRTSGYGLCRRCRVEIPHERLKVQPDALFCVPCLTVVEEETAGN